MRCPVRLLTGRDREQAGASYPTDAGAALLAGAINRQTRSGVASKVRTVSRLGEGLASSGRWRRESSASPVVAGICGAMADLPTSLPTFSGVRFGAGGYVSRPLAAGGT